MAGRAAAITIVWIGLAGMALAANPDTKCFDDVAMTRAYGLGTPVGATPTPDGKTVLFLRSGPRDTVQRLYALDLASGQTRELITPEALLKGQAEHLTAEEKARRERARVTVKGFTFFSLTKDGRRILLSQSGKLYVIELNGRKVTALPGEAWMAPEWSPDGTKVAALRNDDLHVIDIASGKDRQLTAGANGTLTHGEAEFVAQEEMDRREGFWWSPDSRFIAYEEADLSSVEIHYIADPLRPSEKPVEFRYPRAGTANAIVRLGVIPAAGGRTVWVAWDNKAYPYLGRVVWTKGGPLSLLVMNREQTEERFFAADARTGATRLLWTERDAAWLDLETPVWLEDGSGFLWMTERGGQRQLERHAPDGKLKNPVTPASFRFDALLDADPHSGNAIVAGGQDRLSVGVWRVALGGGAPVPVAVQRGFNGGKFGDQHAVFAHSYSLADGQHGVDILTRTGARIAELPSAAEAPSFMPKPDYFIVGRRGMDAMVLKPRIFDPGRKYPVILSVYAGPAGKMVWAAPRRYFEEQCIADRGYIVAMSDNRGTPGRDRAWLRAVKGNAIDVPLADQVEALQALGKRVPQMDMARVGVYGWSFGGYFTAMAMLRRPDVFAAGIAGAPVVDWQDYDTFYTERYMGPPQNNAAGYKASNVLTYASALRRPLLIVHGITDDNVYFENTMKLTVALLRAGRPYDLLLLPGTHLTADDLLRARETERQMDFFAKHLGEPR